ncbi:MULTISPECIES: DUF2922 domain-containing protein [Gemella]|uniref:DUF2922 domain-containing protein n=1 Tax=Gemella TaxID=1378 RepID=UPI0007681AFD|nr:MULTISPECIES: DUF2922 domain-containing protein [Gemella]AME08846.1 hypothetical protein AXE85_00870 [Gemella sp. oral taxon 928]AXI26415.1 DUF2922 domain-containing protein [Gemella sp. ND 6198]
MEKTLILDFITEDKKSYRVNINHPKDNLNKAAVEPVAQKIIDSKVFNSDKRVLTSLKKVAYVTREEAVLE